MLRVLRLAFGHATAGALLTDIDLHLSAGWTGLVGANGAGKTTLLRLIAGELAADAGRIQVTADGPIVLCPQTVEEAPLHDGSAIARFARDEAREARRLRGELRLDTTTLARWTTLSPGERKRWQLGAALASPAGVLLLDEPTNHLDDEGRDLLLAALASRGASVVGIVVSHDRALLEAITTRTIRLHGGTARVYDGAYGAARAEWEAEARASEMERARLRRDERAAAARLDVARRERAAADASRSTRHRMKDKHDHDGRGALAKGQAAAAERRLGRSVQVARADLERTTARLESAPMRKEKGGTIAIDDARAPMPHLAVLDAPVIRAGDRIVLTDVRLTLGRDDRIHVRGPNGAGKSTLLGALLAATRVPEARILHVPQELGAGDRRALLQRVRELDPASRGSVLAIVAALGSDPDRLLGSRDPSPGEARKLAIALGLGRRVWALVLDEPTNHLDLPSIERLESALTAYAGALVVVTHDDAFAKATTSRAWRIEGGRVREGAVPG